MKKVIGIGVLLQTTTGTFLFQERDHNTHLYPGQIAPFGGGIEGDESVFECAKREMSEELDLILDDMELNKVGLFAIYPEADEYIQMFTTQNIDKSKLKLNEGLNIIELSKEEALQHENVTDFTKEVLGSLNK